MWLGCLLGERTPRGDQGCMALSQLTHHLRMCSMLDLQSGRQYQRSSYHMYHTHYYRSSHSLLHQSPPRGSYLRMLWWVVGLVLGLGLVVGLALVVLWLGLIVHCLGLVLGLGSLVH